MKRKYRFFCLLFLLLSIAVQGQNQQKFTVTEFVQTPLDLTAQTDPYKKVDGSGSLYAIIKVTSDKTDDELQAYQFNFGNMNHFVENHEDQLWVYVQRNAKQVTITRSGYMPVRNYDLSTTIEAGHTYSMRLSTQTPVVYTQMVMFTVEPADSKARIMYVKEDSDQPEEVFGDIDETGGVTNSLEFGTYRYKVNAMNYYPSEGRFTLNSETETHIEQVTLRRYGSLVTLTVPSDADIYVNGVKRGTRQWKGVLKTGNYRVECRQTNHRSSQQTISVQENSEQTYQLAAPTPITGVLAVTSRPSGARITVDGKDYGTTPRSITDLLIGHHIVVFSKDGYAQKSEECDVRENDTQNINVSLEKSRVQVNTPTIEVANTNEKTYTSDKTFTVGGVTFTMKAVEGGTFTMGATSEQGSDAQSNEKPAHQVTLSNYMIGETEVTQDLWQAVMGINPSKSQGENLPVVRVSWDDCHKFITKLNQLTGQQFRLPTEAEWEYAARGGNKSRSFKYSGSNNLDEVGWYSENSGENIHPVKSKAANELGIYDMSGNVCEWCQDRLIKYSSSSQTNPTVSSTGTSPVCRGGGWDDKVRDCRVSNRSSIFSTHRGNNLGLRLAL